MAKGSTFVSFMEDEAFLQDEQGKDFPPALCPVARVQEYAGEANSSFNEALVQIEAFDFETGLYSTIMESCGFRLLCRREELVPVNKLGRELIVALPESMTPSQKDRDLRKDLLRAHRDVPYDVIAGWGAETRKQIVVWVIQFLDGARDGKTSAILPKLPPELEAY